MPIERIWTNCHNKHDTKSMHNNRARHDKRIRSLLSFICMWYSFLDLSSFSCNLWFINCELFAWKKQPINLNPIICHYLYHIPNHKILCRHLVELSCSKNSDILLSLFSFDGFKLFFMKKIVHRLDSNHKNHCQEYRESLHPSPTQSLGYDAEDKRYETGSCQQSN